MDQANNCNPKIFKAYDVRGFYPEEINPQAVAQIGAGLIRFLSQGKKDKPLTMVIAQDNRFSSPVLAEALKEAIRAQGANVVDIGLSTTPMFYFTVWQYGYDGGVIVTASHNPPEYNGLKIVREQATPIGINNGLAEIKRLTVEAQGQEIKGKGRLEEKNILQEYLDFILSRVNLQRIKPLNIAVDTSNAVPGIVVEQIKEKLPGHCYHLFPELDGTFPNHLPNPLEEKNIAELKKIVQEKELDLGVAFDGDGDRIIFVDEKGEMIPSDFIIALIAGNLLKEKPGARVLYNVCSSNIIKDVVEENGGVAIMGKIGHTFIKEQMKEEQADFAGELSGHYFFGQPYFFESPFFVFFKVLEEISTSGKTISQLIAPFKKYFNSGQINIAVADKENRLALLEEKFKKGEVSRLDGLRIDFPNWWFNARPSNTEDLLRIVVEAVDKETMERQLKTIKGLLD